MSIEEKGRPIQDTQSIQGHSSLSGGNNDHPAYNSRLIKVYLEYLERNTSVASIDAILKNAGMTFFEVDDPGHWFTQKQVDDFYDQVIAATRDPDIAHKVGRYVATSIAIGLPRQLTLGLLSLKAVYTLIGPLSNILTRPSEVKTKVLGPTVSKL